MPLLLHYRPMMADRPSTFVACCTCETFATRVWASTVFGVMLHMEFAGWRRLHPDWYTLWQCPNCQIDESGGKWAKATVHFGVIFPTALQTRKGIGVSRHRGRRRHDEAQTTKGKQGKL